jgi:AcrR family transcriptional regulator
MTQTYRGVPMEARRAKRRERLIAAGLEEFGTVGYDGTTVKAICATAGLTERYFYEHFADRAALLAAVFEDVVETVMTAAIGAADDAPPTPLARARAGLEGFLGALGADPRRARVQLIEVVGRNETLERRRFGVMHQFVAYIERTATELDPSVDFERESWRHAVVLALVGGTNHLAIEWALGELSISKDDMVDALVALYLAASDATVSKGDIPAR